MSETGRIGRSLQLSLSPISGMAVSYFALTLLTGSYFLIGPQTGQYLSGTSHLRADLL